MQNGRGGQTYDMSSCKTSRSQRTDPCDAGCFFSHFFWRNCVVFIFLWGLLKRKNEELTKKRPQTLWGGGGYFLRRPFINNPLNNRFYLFVNVPFHSVIWWHLWQQQPIILHSMCVCLLFEADLIKARLVVEALAFSLVHKKERKASIFKVTVLLLAW